MEVGHTFTLWETPRLNWWRRVAVRLGLQKNPEPALRTYHVTATNTYCWPSGVLMEPWHNEDPGLEAPGAVIVRVVGEKIYASPGAGDIEGAWSLSTRP